jgi:hypothetical protein
MKRISTLLASLILTVAVFAAEKPKSTLSIQSFDKAGLRVVIDGRRFEPNDNYLTINGIEPGFHQVKIYHQKNNGLFSIVGKRYEVVFNGSIDVKQRSNTLISVDRFGKATVSSNRSNNNGGWSGRDDRGRGRNNDYDFDRGNRAGDYSNDRGGKFGDYDNNYGYESGMSDREFSTVMQSIQKEWLESNKLKSASHIVAANKLTSAQVKQLVLLFSFESNKLDLAKQAYANTVDKRNYSMLNDAFSFNSSKDELARFIRNIR